MKYLLKNGRPFGSLGFRGYAIECNENLEWKL